MAPFDVVVALRLATDAGTLSQIADELAVVPSQVHTSIARLGTASLLKPGARSTSARALHEFAVHGLRYAFPARKGPLVLGIATAYSAQPLSGEIDALDVVVWPAPLHRLAVQGFGIAPLYRAAHQLCERSPAMHQLVALVDALRLDDAQLRVTAAARLAERLGVRA